MGRKKGYKASEEEKALHAELAARMWAAMSEEERELVRLKQKLGALKRWRARTEEERRRIGRAISEGKRRAKGKRNEQG